MHKRSLKKRERIRNKRLLKRYPWLWPVDWYGWPIHQKKLNYSFTCLDDIPRGWRATFGMMMINDIDKELHKYNYHRKFHILQIKEKYGELRFYHTGAPGKVGEIIDAYEHLSTNICIECGKTDVPMVNGGWISPYCEKCYMKSNHRTLDDYIRFADNNNTMTNEIRYSRYSKEKDDWETRIIDISEYTNKVRKKYEAKALHGHTEYKRS